MPLLDQVREYIVSDHLILPDEKVIVGVSGGPDSVCLLHLLCQLACQMNLTLHVAHLNHAIRDKAGDADAVYVAALCRDWQLDYTLERIDVPAFAREQSLSLEEAARQARYAFLARTAAARGARVIAVGHHADDQVETILMHLLRGAGLEGMRGMRPVSHLNAGGQPGGKVTDVRLVRPLLHTTRAEIESYCEENALVPRRDLSNNDTILFRNRLRHELLPYLEQYNPNIRNILLHTSEVIGADLELIAGLANQAWNQVIISRDSDTICFDLALFRAQPRALQRLLIRQGLSRLDFSLRDVTFSQLENALNIVNNGSTGRRAALPGNLNLQLSYNVLYLTRLPEAPGRSIWPRMSLAYPVQVPVPGELVNAKDHWRLICQVRPRDQFSSFDTGEPGSIMLAQETLSEPLLLTTRRPGDALKPLGMHGQTQKLHDLFINAKVPSTERSFVPVLRSGDDIVWVAGFRQDQRFAVKDTTDSIVVLKFGPIEES
ncbi:MAG: tRNA lysidine(34) synthetase TilS [Anaerolineae bacterium]